MQIALAHSKSLSSAQGKLNVELLWVIITVQSLVCSFPKPLKLFIFFLLKRKASGSGDLTSDCWSTGQGLFEALDSSQDNGNVSFLVGAQGAIRLQGDAVVLQLLLLLWHKMKSQAAYSHPRSSAITDIHYSTGVCYLWQSIVCRRRQDSAPDDGRFNDIVRKNDCAIKIDKAGGGKIFFVSILMIRNGNLRLERKMYSASSARPGFLRSSFPAEAFS